MSRSMLSFLVILGCCTQFVAAQDTVYRRGGKSVVGVINGMSKLDLTIAVSGKDEKIPANEIARISVEGEPSAMSDVRASLAQK